jgi:multiple sugar transport system permease protein
MNLAQIIGVLSLACIVLLIAGRGQWLEKPRAVARLLLLCVVGMLMLVPFVWLISAAFKNPDVMTTYAFFPPIATWTETLGLANFRELLKPRVVNGVEVGFARYLVNSLFLASAGTCLQLLCCSMGGYALAKFRFTGRSWLLGFMLGTMVIPGMILLAPLYRMAFHIGWLDSWLMILIPGSVSAFGLFLFRQAMDAVPNDLLEAARIDGCGEGRIYFHMVMPLVRPVSGAFCLVSFLGNWNNFLGPQVFLSSQESLTLPVVLSQYVGMYSSQYGVFLAGTLVAIIPPAVLFFALQREFISGLTSGAVKG